MAKASSKIGLDDWQLPSMMPREVDGLTTVGVPMPDYPEIEDFEAAWFGYDLFNWELDDLNRREWATEIIAHFDQWKRYLGHDSTAIFKRTIQQKRAKGGILVGVRGIKGGGKSRLGQMVIQRICNVTPHVLFQYKDIAVQIKSVEGDEVGLLIDEDLTATGQDSANLVIHVNNSWETNRKAIQSGVCTGVNLSFEKWGNTLDIRLEPCGINPDFLATRFGMFTSKNRFLGFGALQFKHLPEDPVYYYNRLGTWQEYDKEAVAFSRTVTRSGGALDAVDDISQTEHIERLKLEFKVRFIDKGLVLPPDIACRRIYRKAKLPSKSIGYMNEVIWWAKDELEESPSKAPFIPSASKGWDGLRSDLHRWFVRHKMKSKTAHYLADWYVSKGLNQTQIGEQYGVSRDTIQKTVLRYKDIFRGKETELGMLAEHWLAAHTDSLGAVVGTGGKESDDVLLTIGSATAALNVKWVLTEPKYRRNFDSSPEHEHLPNAWLAVVNSMTNTIRLHPVTGPQTYAHHETGVPCAPEMLEDTLKEMIQIEA